MPLELSKQVTSRGEGWKSIKGYPGIYIINKSGKVISLGRKIIDGRFRKEKEMKQTLSSTGYFMVQLSKEGVIKGHSIHRLVANTFIPNPHKYLCVNHKNTNKKDNSIENLEWCSYKQNSEHAKKNGLLVVPWNKGNRKERPTMICEWCGGTFLQKKRQQILCSSKCTAHRNGNIRKRKANTLSTKES